MLAHMKLCLKNVKNIKKYRGKIPLFHYANIEKELNNIFEPTVKLKSGGYLVINPTEALVAIDVNSGQSTKQINIEIITTYPNNLINSLNSISCHNPIAIQSRPPSKI